MYDGGSRMSRFASAPVSSYSYGSASNDGWFDFDSFMARHGRTM
jgi:hypothetical protein